MDKSIDAVSVLTEDNNRVRGLFRYFAQLEGSGVTDERANVAIDICKELVIHAAMEEELLYPAARTAIGDNDLINQAEIEQGTTKFLIRQLLPINKSDERFNAKVTVLREYVKHHMDEEEKVMLPRLKHTKIDLDALGRQLAERREALRDELKTADHLVGFEPLKYFVGRDLH